MQDFVVTEDGSLTLLNGEAGELYHNRAGAYTEAWLNYYQPAFAKDVLDAGGGLSVVDLCFGLGYNTFVLLEKLAEDDARGHVQVIAVDIDEAILPATARVLADRRLSLLQKAFADRPPVSFGEYELSLNSRLKVSLSLIRCDLRLWLNRHTEPTNLIFHDPFSPRQAPQLWTVDIFQRCYQLLSVFRGKLLTYSSAGAVRGGLMAAGFQVFRTAAVGGKNGGTLAVADRDFAAGEPVFSLSDEESRRLAGRSGVPYRDSSFSGTKDDIIRRRMQEQSLL